MITRLWKALFCWDFTPGTEDQFKSAQLIVTQAWSRRKDQTPGAGNLLLARTSDALHALTHLPVLPQEEVAWALSPDTKVADIAGGSTTGASSTEWNTGSVALLQNTYCEKHRLNRVIVVAHPLHMDRALKVYLKLGLYAIAADVPRNLGSYQDPDLVHWYFRYPWMVPIAWVRELLARILFVLQGKM